VIRRANGQCNRTVRGGFIADLDAVMKQRRARRRASGVSLYTHTHIHPSSGFVVAVLKQILLN
jgi:hypothetical protein